MTITSDNIFVSDQKDVVSEKAQSYKSLGHFVLQSLSNNEFADRVIIRDISADRQWTGAQLRDRILNIATGLIDLFNLQPGTMVCIRSDNSDIKTLLCLGVICAGGTVAFSDTRDPYAELLYLHKKLDFSLLFCQRDVTHWTGRLEVDTGCKIRAIVMEDEETTTNQQYCTIWQLMNHDHKVSKSLQLIPVACQDRKRDVAVITMTSGTTGLPKAVPASHDACIWDSVPPPVTNLPIICIAGFDYVSGRVIMTRYICAGNCIILMKDFEPKSYLDAVEKYQLDKIMLGTAAFYKMIKYPQLSSYELKSVKLVAPIGAKLTYKEELRQFLDQYPHITLVGTIYGTSEFANVTGKLMSTDQFLTDCDNNGKLKPGVKAKIVHQVTGQSLGPEQIGVLHIKSQSMMTNYYEASNWKRENNNDICKSDKEEVDIFDKDGFYISGDLAYFNLNEELYIVGREKELMSCRGAKKVLPIELESILLRHPSVKQACVLGVANKNEPTLHCPRAFVVPESIKTSGEHQNLLMIQPEQKTEDLKHEGSHTLCKLLPEAERRKLAEDLMEFSNQQIGWEKQLTGGIVILDELPITKPSGKINKNYLKSLSYDQVEIYGDRSG